MCGICGYIASSKNPVEPEILNRMTFSLAHRGPDNHDIWYDIKDGVALGHRRLSVIDVSTGGHQPSVSHNGRFVIVYNGEVYNYREIKSELERDGIQFNSTSDTEVILEAIALWGLENAVKRFVGMFAFALWDKSEKKIYLVRDRLGIKPLYYGWMGNVFLFGSELKALRCHPEFHAEIDQNALALFMRYAYVPAPFSIYRNIRKLEPGKILELSIGKGSSRSETMRSYWSALSVAERGCSEPFDGSDDDAEEELEKLLRDSIRLRMISDVPLGAFLSGGIDSSTVAALMQSECSSRVKTFSIGFDEDEYDEASHAKSIAHRLGTDHTELYVSSEKAQSVIPKIADLYDEPFADVSQIPVYLVSELARKHVTVCLSGDGGDELFGGYSRYFWAPNIWRSVSWVPRRIRRAASAGLNMISPHSWDKLFGRAGFILPKKYRQRNPGDKFQKISTILTAENEDEVYLRLQSHWLQTDRIMNGGESSSSGWGMNVDSQSFVNKMMLSDLTTYLPDDILTKLDRASMGVSLEARVPLLDHRTVEFAWKLPLSMKVRDGAGKHLLRNVLYKYVDRSLLERPKMGFGVPIDSWLRGPLREWAESLIGDNRIRNEGFLNPISIRTKWKEHLSGRRNWQNQIWNVLMFQSWLDKWKVN